MKPAAEFKPEECEALVLPSQYNDLVRRRSPLNDEDYRLLWRVLEEATRTPSRHKRHYSLAIKDP
jgi:hypothetical protein